MAHTFTQPDSTRTPTTSPDTAITVSSLSKAYDGRTVLSDLDLEIAQQEIFGILGHNGAGKTTAVEAMQGLRRADRGTVRILGHDPVRERPAVRRLVGAQLQSSELPERLRVGEALRLFTRLAGDVVCWRTLRDDWGLERLERSAFGALSGGERQRLFIALALAGRPRVVFFDELTQGLDPTARRETWRLVRQVREQGATVVVVTHFMDEAEQLCDRVGILHDGRLLACDTPVGLVADLRARVRVRFTAREEPAGLAQVPGVHRVRLESGRTDVEADPAAVVGLASYLHDRGLAPTDLTVLRPSLEDAFLALTTGGV